MSLNAVVDEHGTVERWHSELPLFIVCAMVSAVLWVLLAVSIIGLAYSLVLGAFFFVAHVAFVSYVKGNAVRIGPEQFPDLHAAVERLSRRVGLTRTPDAYVMESGGALNAFATRFLRSNIIVLFSDLLEACGDDVAARDMIIAHELGHIRAGHLRWHWLLLPSAIVPFLGSALSRAREYTCDRYGLHGAGDRDGALRGLTILAAGGKLAGQVNRRALARQRDDLNTGWMTIGEWLASHPPLAKRIAALDPSLLSGWHPSYAGPVRAIAIMGAIPLLGAIGITAAILAGSQLLSPLEWLWDNELAAASAALTPTSDATVTDPEAATKKAEDDMRLLAGIAAKQLETTKELPEDWDALIKACAAQNGCATPPTDPFDGAPYGYINHDSYFMLYSSGRDGEPQSDDDIVYDSRAGQFVRGWATSR